MTFACTEDDCDWSLPVEMHPVGVDTSTGEVYEKDAQDLIDEKGGPPPCPECGGEMEYTEE